MGMSLFIQLEFGFESYLMNFIQPSLEWNQVEAPEESGQLELMYILSSSDCF